MLLSALQSGFDQHLAAAKSAEAIHDFRTAETEYENALAIHSDGEIYQRLGLPRHLQHDFNRAIQPFEKAIRLKSDLEAPCLFLGIYLSPTTHPPQRIPTS